MFCSGKKLTKKNRKNPMWVKPRWDFSNIKHKELWKVDDHAYAFFETYRDNVIGVDHLEFIYSFLRELFGLYAEKPVLIQKTPEIQKLFRQMFWTLAELFDEIKEYSEDEGAIYDRHRAHIKENLPKMKELLPAKKFEEYLKKINE